MPNFTCIVCAICAVERVILTPTRLTVELKLFVAPSLPRLPAPITTANTGSLSWPLRSRAYQFVCIGCPHAMRVLALNKTHDASDSVAFPTLNPWFYSKFQRASNRHKIDKTVKSKVHFMFLSNALKTFRIALGRNYYIILASIRCQRLSKAPLSWTGASKWRHLTTCYVLPAPTSLLSDSLQLFHRLWHLPPLEYRSFSPEHLLHAIWSTLGHATPLHRFLLLMHSIGLRQLAMQGDLRKTCICCNYVWACVILFSYTESYILQIRKGNRPQNTQHPKRHGSQTGLGFKMKQSLDLESFAEDTLSNSFTLLLEPFNAAVFVVIALVTAGGKENMSNLFQNDVWFGVDNFQSYARNFINTPCLGSHIAWP